ncbi:MAG: alpha-amylase family glycosyl hydrolase [Anaerolineaceae bacterium]|jgi:glycosidase
MMEFHISRKARDHYQFDLALFAYDGNVILANFHAARLFAQKINQKQDLVAFPEKAVKAGQINAMGLIDEILHHVVSLYRQQVNMDVVGLALSHLEQTLGQEAIAQLLQRFVEEFPPVAVYQRQLTAEEYLAAATDGISNRNSTLEELALLWVANKNPALSPYLELFSDDSLVAETIYPKAMQELHNFLDTQPPFGPDRQNLLDMLHAPAVAVPYSLSGQLEFIRQRWADLLGSYLYRLLSSLDLVKEEEKLTFQGFGPGPVLIPVYNAATALNEPERFSTDREWMPRLVLIAKNTYVWLDQLSKKYGRPIQRLDEIPDEELDQLSRWGFTGLWLIGLWERSKASARIKQLCGNPNAISSAYSLYEYRIAVDLGGEDACHNLHERAWQHGIRLASDMVPNHMGIDSPWVIEHPDWFLSLDESPYPTHSFDGPNLSNNSNTGIYIEDHYFDRSDAAVEFKRVDYYSGQARYIYHGNDGTSMPWNDTAQLNYLNPEVREAVIKNILNIAHDFSIIRFDAAMTLTKKHYQRLWFPEPGTGGAIPTRSEHGMTKEAFDAAMPNEFWREVVDRMAQEAPDTLLLAEAFWLMEGYFVRTLGMHRVYNSAFMNMLRDENNSGYRQLIKNTLEFDPEILKRYVNFMNNPDERTAVDQFGKGDKYFGICTLMATLPGLPMFGHGQVEGFSEKYGMEFRKALQDEAVDPYLVERHQREIFPLLHHRQLFSGVENFLLYNFHSDAGGVDENVFAFSNQYGKDAALVVYHNKFNHTSGWINFSSGNLVKNPGGQNRITHKSLGEGLGIQPAKDTYVIFRDQSTNMEFIRPSQELCLQGLHLDLEAYQYHVFMDFRSVSDDAWGSYRQLCSYLGGQGVPSIAEAMKALLLAPIQRPFQEIANIGYFKYLLANRLGAQKKLDSELISEFDQKVRKLFKGVAAMTGSMTGTDALVAELRRKLILVLSLPTIEQVYPLPGGKTYQKAVAGLKTGLEGNDERWLTLFGWLFTHSLGKLAGDDAFEDQSQSWLDEWQLGKVLAEAYQDFGIEASSAARMVNNVRFMIGQQNWYGHLGKLSLSQILENWLSDPSIQQFLGINRFQDILWFNQEAFDELLWWMKTLAIVQTAAEPTFNASQFIECILGLEEIVSRLSKAEKTSDFQIALLVEAVAKKSAPAVPRTKKSAANTAAKKKPSKK